jgi:hypothetical protein
MFRSHGNVYNGCIFSELLFYLVICLYNSFKIVKICKNRKCEFSMYYYCCYRECEVDKRGPLVRETDSRYVTFIM